MGVTMFYVGIFGNNSHCGMPFYLYLISEKIYGRDHVGLEALS
jgi:hypothetical protein